MRSPVSDISVIGRNTQGVRVIRLSEDDSFVAVVMPREQEDSIVDEAEDGPASDQAAFETEPAEAKAPEPDAADTATDPDTPASCPLPGKYALDGKNQGQCRVPPPHFLGSIFLDRALISPGLNNRIEGFVK